MFQGTAQVEMAQQWAQVSRGLQLPSLWRIPTAAVSQRVTAYSCDPYGESLLQL